MPRAISLILAAGLAGAAATTILHTAASVPAAAQGAATQARGEVATVDVLKLLEIMLETETYATARTEAGDVWNEQITPLADEMTALRQTITNMDPNDPTAPGLYQQYQSLQQRANSLQQQANVALDQMSAEQLADAYRKVHAAANAVATEKGYQQVFASRMGAEDMGTQNTNVVVQEVLLRPVLMNRSGEDITELVRLDLGLPEAAPEAPAEGPAQPPAGQPQDQNQGAEGGDAGGG